MSRQRVRAVVLVLLVVAGGFAPLAEARSVDLSAGPPPAAAASSDTVGSCFPPGGHRMEIGEFGPRMVLVIHTSLFPNVFGETNVTTETVENGTLTNDTDADEALQPVDETAAGALGLEASGTALDQRIVFLQTGVVYAGVDDAATLLSNPFEAFAIVFTYEFSLPVFSPFGLDSEYESTESPVSGVETVDCADV